MNFDKIEKLIAYKIGSQATFLVEHFENSFIILIE